MNGLERSLADLRAKKRPGFAAFITAGYPDARATEELVPALIDAGADIIELGVPFSDPIADGPVIQASSEQALRAGMSFSRVCTLTERLRARVAAPILAMSYMNPLFHQGLERSVRMAAHSGIDGFIVPDCIPEESGPLAAACEACDVSLIHLCSPTSTDGRLRWLNDHATGFVYIVSVAGVTGARAAHPARTRAFLEHTRAAITRVPRFIGFGISGPDQARVFAGLADGIIIGSAFIECITRARSRQAAVRDVARLARSVRRALDADRI